jgi:hypothetical protein
MCSRFRHLLITTALAAACARSDTSAGTTARSSAAAQTVRAVAVASNATAVRTEDYDGRWWLHADSAQRAMFISGFIDCKSADIPGRPTFRARSLQSYQDSVTAYYAADSSRRTQSFFSVLSRFADRSGEHPPAGGETYSSPHGFFDGAYWRLMALQGGRPAREAFVAGYLVCRNSLGRSLPDRFSRPASEYRARIDAWYGLDERTGDVEASRESVKIAAVLQQFADKR